MRGHHRQAQLGRQRHRMAHLRFLVGLAGALDLDIEMAGENRAPSAARIALGQRQVAVFDGDADVAEMRARQHDQAIGRAFARDAAS